MNIQSIGTTPTKNVAANNEVQTKAKASSGNFDSLVKGAKEVSGQKPVADAAFMQDVSKLAAQVSSGKLSSQEAGQEFVKLIMANNWSDKLGKKNTAVIESVVGQFVGSDQELNGRISNNLRKLDAENKQS